MKTSIEKLRNPNYLGGWDFKDENGKTIDKVVTIKEIKTENVFQQASGIEEPVIEVHFNECKPIILNATNRKMLKKVTGTEFIEEMTGKKIQLTTKRIKAFGEFHDAIRIVNKAPTAAKIVPVDVKKCLAKVNACKTAKDLIAVWTAFSTKEKNTPEVLAAKEKLKSELTN